MFNSSILDLVILLSFTYFICSLILSAITESLSGFLRLRQNNLRQALESFFFSPEWKIFVRTRLVKNPGIESLMKFRGRTPAYIPPQNFILAILSYLNPDKLKEGKIESKVDEKIISTGGVNQVTILPIDFTNVLSMLMLQENLSNSELASMRPLNNQERFEKNLESFYNNTMDRVTGRYKTKIRKLLLITALPLTVVLNIDTIKITNDALKDQARLSKTVDNIASEISKVSLLADSIIIKDSVNGIIVRTKKDLDTTNVSEKARQQKSMVLYYEQATGYNLGYKNWEDFAEQWKDQFFLKILGTLITVFALQLGSTFWFDTINKAINIRSVGKKPEDNSKKTNHNSNTG